MLKISALLLSLPQLCIMDKGWRLPHDMIGKHSSSPGSKAMVMMVVLGGQEGGIMKEGGRKVRKPVNPNEPHHNVLHKHMSCASSPFLFFQVPYFVQSPDGRHFAYM